MTEAPQFRTVLRGADPEQVAEAVKELQTSLVVSRRAAADRTIELSRLQEEHQALQAKFDAAQQRLTELEKSGGKTGSAGSTGHGYGDLGARIGSMLSLAEEEATQIRAAAETEAAERRDHAVKALAAELVAEEARLDDTKARTAALEEELTRQRARADEEHGHLRELAMQEAEHIRAQARADAQALHQRAEEQRAAAVAHRDHVHEHLGRISALIGGVLQDRPEDRPEDRLGNQPQDRPDRHDQAGDAAQSDGSASSGADASSAEVDRTVDDVAPVTDIPSRDADTTVPDATHPDPHTDPRPDQGDQGDRGDGRADSGRRPTETPAPALASANRRQPAYGSNRSADATQVIEPVPAQPARPPQPQPSRARESRQHYADAGDSFVGEPWHEEDSPASR